MFVRKNLITRFSSRQSSPNDVKILLIELNFRKQNWLICCCYNPHKNLISYLLQELAKVIQTYSNNYDDILLVGAFNAEVSETSFSSFWELYEVNPSCINLFLRNSPNSFQKSTVVETGASNFHKLTSCDEIIFT